VILFKSPLEIASMRQSGALLASVLASLRLACTPGRTTASLDALAEELIRSQGAIPGFKGYNGFQASLCVSINDEVIHGIPSPYRHLHEGDLVSLDCGLILDGWWADAGLSVGVGSIDPQAAKLLHAASQALTAGINAARAGRHLEDISSAIQRSVEHSGFNVVRSYAGHGVGKSLHEDPPVPNWGRPGNGPLLQPGMVLAIEPMVVAGSPSVYVKEDGWTVATIDRSLSSYFEHTVAVTPSGPLILTQPA
jgi:methionyl aminopeptidase